MPFSPSVLGLLSLLEAYPDGVSREEARRVLVKYEGTPPEVVDRTLDKLLELGVVEARGDLVVPLPAAVPLARKMERLAMRINRREAQRDQAMDLVKMLFRGP